MEGKQYMSKRVLVVDDDEDMQALLQQCWKVRIMR